MRSGTHRLRRLTAYWSGVAACLAFALAACGEARRGGELPVEATASRVDVFLRAAPTDLGVLTMLLDEVRLRDDAGATRLLQLDRSQVDSAQAVRRLSLAGGIVPPGSYASVVLRVRGATLLAAGERHELRLAPDVDDAAGAALPAAGEAVDYDIPVRVEVRPNDAVSLFLEWNVTGSLLSDDSFRPVFSVGLERPQVRLGLLYVSDRATGSVLALDRTTGEVVATGKAGAEPAALAIARNRIDLYAANQGDGSISFLDTRRNLQEFVVPIRFAARTSDVVVADEGRMIAACNPGTDTVSLFDTQSVSRVTDVRVGRSPVRLAAAQRLRRLYVVNALSNQMSVIDLNALDVIATLGLEADPSYVEVDRREEHVFVGHRTSPNVLIYDAQSLGLLDTIFVGGGGVTAMLADRRLDRVFVACEHPNEIAVIDRRLGAVLRHIRISGRVTGLAQPVEGPLIYGAAPDRGGLIVIDVTLGKELPLLPCGRAPSDVVVVD